MDRFEIATLAEGYGASCQDRVGVFHRDGIVAAVVADGAGGTSGGAAAAALVLDHVKRALEDGRNSLNALTWRQVLLEVGTQLEVEAIGQTTAVVVATDGRRVCGASVGDSGAWMIGSDDLLNLSEGKRRKPLLGDRLVEPATFSSDQRYTDTLLLATDGVLKYAPPDKISATVRRGGMSADECCAALVQLARLPNGTLQDDVGVVLIRCTRGALEAGVATAARAWSEALTDAQDIAARSAVERAFADQLERWIASLLPREPQWNGRWFDGLLIEAYAFGSADSVDVCGWIWRIEPQMKYPFEARLSLEGVGFAEFEVLFGDRAPFDAESSRAAGGALSLGVEREWMFRFRGPPSTRF